MKTVVQSREVAHLWAHKAQSEARNANRSMFFTDSTIYSYGSHFPMAKHVTNKRGENAILFNERSYSVTTSKHQGYVRQSIPHGSLVFTVPSLDERYSREPNNDTNIKYYRTTIQNNLESAARARKQFSRDYLIRNANRLANELQAYGKFFGIKVPKIKLPEVSDLDALKKELSARAAKQAAKQRRENAQQIREWRAGERSHVSSPDTMLRIVGSDVETSRGARFPVAHACKGLTLVEACVSSNREWVRNGHTLHLGHYQIDRIEANGTVHAGCHIVPYPEISLIAPKLREMCKAIADHLTEVV